MHSSPVSPLPVPPKDARWNPHLVGAGMLLGGILYALSLTWIDSRILNVANLGKIR